MASKPQPSRSSARDLSLARNEKLRKVGQENLSYKNQANKSRIFSENEPAVTSTEVQQRENAILSVPLEAKLEALSIRNQKFPSRPEYVSGPSIKLRTNHFQILTNPKAVLYRYTVAVEGLESRQTRKKKRIIELLLENSVLLAAKPVLATDFAGLIVTGRKLNLESVPGEKESQIFDVQYRDEAQATARPGAPSFKVRIEFENTVSLADLTDYLNSPFNHPMFNKDDAITALNIIVSWSPTCNPAVFSGAKSTKFYPLEDGEEKELGPGLVALKGYYSSVRTSVGRLLLNINVCTSVFLLDGRVDLIIRLFNNNLVLAEAFLKKRRISTDYLGAKRFKVITGFARHEKTKMLLKPNQAIIKLQSGENISVADYFKREHRNGIPLINLELPLILAGTSKIDKREVPCWIPAEECRIIPGQPYGKKLSGQQTTTMLKFAALPPAENARRIVGEAGRVLGLTSGRNSLQYFGITILNKMIVVDGRKLEAPAICYRNRILSATNGSWNMIGTQFKTMGHINHWSFLHVVMPLEDPRSRKEVTADVIKEFIKVMGWHGFRMPSCTNGPRGFGFSVNVNTDWDRIDEQLRMILTVIRQRSVTVLLVILDKEDAYLYSRLKFLADLVFGIHTVHVVAANMLKSSSVPSAQYIANLALKFNLKLGGINHSQPLGRLGFLQKGTTMVVGIDVTHPSPGQIKDGPSIAAVVASIDKNLAQWPCSLRTQRRQNKGADEVVQEQQLGPMIMERLTLWEKNNGGSLPERLLVYRDGVSESQYEEIIKTEISTIEEACRRKGSKGMLMAVVVVGKRHHTRFYPTNDKETDCKYHNTRNANPQPGTVVDRGITMENGWDFFLQAHDCLKGTAKPAHYVVLRNDFRDMGPKVLENITHELCYMFGRATRSVSVCPPVRYADLACERGKVYLYKYLTIRPDGRKADDVYDPTLSPWLGTVHGARAHPLVDSMFYI